MNLPNGTLFINPSLDGDTNVFGVWILREGGHQRAAGNLYHARSYGTIGEALAYIEGRLEQRQISGTTRDTEADALGDTFDGD